MRLKRAIQLVTAFFAVFVLLTGFAYATKVYIRAGSGGSISPPLAEYPLFPQDGYILIDRNDVVDVTVTPNPYFQVDTLILSNDNKNDPAVDVLPGCSWDQGHVVATYQLGYQTKESYLDATFKPVPPIADFNATPSSGAGEATQAIQFTDQSGNTPASDSSWQWDFGDGNTSTLQNPQHTFADIGTYPVTLTVTNNLNGESHSITQSYNVILPTVTYTPSAGPNGSISPSAPVSVQAGTSTTFSFSPNPYYQVDDVKIDGGSVGAVNSLTFDDATDWDDHNISVSFKPLQVVASFTTDLASGVGEARYPVEFSGTAMNTPDNETETTWAWDFGDGNTITARNPAHTFATPGTYSVTLTVTNLITQETGSVSTEYIAVEPTITYQASAGANGTISPAGSVTVPEYTPTTFTVTPDQYYQVDYVMIDSVNVGAVTEWTFDGSTDLADHSISVYFEPEPTLANFTTNPSGKTEYTTADEIVFVNLSKNTDPAPSYTWDFGDGNTSNLKAPRHTYEQPGDYTVTLEVFNGLALASISKDFTITGVAQGSTVMVGQNGYTFLQTAYDDSAEGDTIKLKADETFDESLTFWFDQYKSITLQGGYDALFEIIDPSTYSRINGQLIISNGTVKVSNIIIGSQI